MSAKKIDDVNILGSKQDKILKTDYFSEIGREKLLSKSEEIAIMKKVKAGDKVAYRTMIEKNLRLVVQIALKYNSQEFGLMDRISEGNLGLIHALEKFDPSKGFRFSTYAHWWIKQSIEKGIMNQGRSVRLPAHVVRLLSKYNKANCRIAKADSASMSEIAHELNYDPEKLQGILSNCESAVHLDQKIAKGDSEIMDIVPDTAGHDGLEVALEDDRNIKIVKIMAKLAPYEHIIIVRHIGVLGNDRNTLLELSKLTGFSKEQVRTREKRAIEKYKEDLLEAL